MAARKAARATAAARVAAALATAARAADEELGVGASIVLAGNAQTTIKLNQLAWADSNHRCHLS